MNKFVRQVKESVNKEEEIPSEEILLIPSGSTLLNCACSDFSHGAFKAGTIVTMPGASASGKTMLILTMFAEICQLRKFNHYSLIYDDAEEALAINIPLLFGDTTANRIKPPKETSNKESCYANTIQDFQNNVLFMVQKEKPFVYVLDSLDALSSDEEMEREYKRAILDAKNPEQIKELKGSYKTEKARIIGQCLRMIKQELKNTKSLLIIIQQERANIGGGMFQKETITSGGKAPFYYSSHQIWMKKIKSIKNDERKIGNKVLAMITKNKLTGKERNVQFDIYNDYGIDDIGSQVDFLVEEGHWTKSKNTILANELNLEETRTKLITEIENRELQKDLRHVTEKAWRAIEESLKLNRKRKYE